MPNSTPVKVRLPLSTYSAQLIGITGTSTAGITLSATYKASWDAHFFDVLISGPYDLWVDPAGGSNYSKDSNWSGSTGKVILGGDYGVSSWF